MASSASYPRKYYFASNNDIVTPNVIPLKAGNVIAAYDTDAFYYDVPNGEGGEVVRRKANGIEFVGDISDARQEPTTIFIVNTGTMLDENGDTINTYSGYRWNDDLATPAFEEVFNNLRDFKVKSEASETTQAYLVGSISNTDDIGTLIKNPNIYLTADGKIHGDLDGKAARAKNADEAAFATIANAAIYDDNSPTPNKISDYIKSITISNNYPSEAGSTLTYIKGDGTPSTPQTIPDTTYKVFTTDANVPGLVNGIATTVNSDNTGLVLSGSGWIDLDDLTIPAAESATKDGDGNVITTTYYADADLVGHTLTLTKGDGTTTTPLTLPDTTYDVFTTNTNGLVPGPSAQQATMFLRGDAHWSALPVFAGSDPGLVPTAAAADAAKYLKGNGTWGSTFSQGTAGLVPGPATSDPTMSLKADGTWSIDTDTKNTAGATNETSAKLFLVGAQAQSTNPQTYTNINVYVDSGKLYQNSNSSATDTFTGDGVEDTFSLSAPGATAITKVMINSVEVSSGFTLDTLNNAIVFTSAPADDATISVTYSIPVTAVQVVDVQSNQTISNKSFLINGTAYPVGTAVGSNIVEVMPPDTATSSDSFTGDGTTTSFELSDSSATAITSVSINDTPVTSGYQLDTETNPGEAWIVFTSAPANNADIEVEYTVSNPGYDSSTVPTVDAVKSYVGNVKDDILARVAGPVLAPAFDDSQTYALGAFCTYDVDGTGVKLYRCSRAVTTADEFDPDDWTAMTVIDAIKWIIANP